MRPLLSWQRITDILIPPPASQLNESHSSKRKKLFIISTQLRPHHNSPPTGAKMCKSLALHHTCTHTISFRLSSCRGTYAHPSLKPRLHPNKPGCTSTPTLTLLSTTPCGTCLQDPLQTRLEEDLAATKLQVSNGETNGWGMPVLSLEGAEVVNEAEAKLSRESWDLQRRFPAGRFKVFRRPERRGRVARGSFLRWEVRAEDVVVRQWGTLEEELAARELEKPVEVREYEEIVERASEVFFGGAEGGTVHEGTLLEAVEEVEEEEEEEEEEGNVGLDLQAPALSANVASASAVRNRENQPPCPRRRAPDPPTQAAPPPANSSAQPPHLRRKAKVVSMRRKAKGQGDDFGEEWFKCVRTSLAVV
ncbi:hypothetical protein EJ03DRAFT_159525 [Teratosphaeria nubilosa]|uniref:Uncharacterized protein n=1 Tax=Teratosphaeria nubilosa TaxID=161662 RepID=A0A6G1L2T5_9PEZI|nr:hypothetical protein EJ03DRAFT_159525 [Teratosphaeria nubilosa]